MSDLISREWLMECVNEGWIKFDTEKDENRFIHLVRDIAPSAQPDIDEFLRNKSPKEHREILHWIAIHYYPRDSKEVLQAVSNMIRPDTKSEEEE